MARSSSQSPSRGPREGLLFAALMGLIVAVYMVMGPAYGLRMTTEAVAFALIALGLTIQWGFGGQFNVGLAGFIALGGFAAMFLSHPVNDAFWASNGPKALTGTFIQVALAAVAVFLAWRFRRSQQPRWITTPVFLLIVLTAWLVVSRSMDSTATLIEKEAVYIGGLGLPVLLSWAVGGLLAGLIGWMIAKVCLDLRSDYLAIATIGIAEIIKSFLKNADWLTKGTLTVSPLPWPVPLPEQVGFVTARGSYLAVELIMLLIVYLLVQAAYSAPWGRMMRAIRDNETAAEAMGKDVKRRRVELFVVGCVFIGIGGAALVSFSRIFDPAGFLPLNYTFAVWLMVILGGAGNARGAIFGAILVYILWTLSEPVTLLVFDQGAHLGARLFGWPVPPDMTARALSMRVFLIGLAILLVLRLAPRGILPEKIRFYRG